MPQTDPLLMLFGGPAGAGKSTTAAAWCATRPRAVHIQLDHLRELIVSGRADPQLLGQLQGEQYALSATACCALARVFQEGGYDVAIDDVFEPEAFERYWQPQLAGLNWRNVLLLPSLEETLRRSRSRTKRVLERHTRAQHAACSIWPESLCIDTTGLGLAESLAQVQKLLS